MGNTDYIKNIINANKKAFLNIDSGIIFEFTAAHIEQLYNIIPSINDNLGFSDVSAIAEINISPELLNELFYFQLAGPLDEDDNSINNENVMNYGISSIYEFDISYSNAITVHGGINAPKNESIKRDYVSYLAHVKTDGESSNINVFFNAYHLLQGVSNLDSGFNQTINDRISNNSSQDGVYLSLDTSNNAFIRSSAQLVTGMFTESESRRYHIFFNDLISQNAKQQANQINSNVYWVPFHGGDKMSILIKYVNDTPDTNTRSYKIVLSCITKFILPENVSNVGLNRKGNLNPSYILKLINEYTNMNYSFNSDSDSDSDSESVSNFISVYNSKFKKINLEIFKQVGYIQNIVDLYYKTFLSNVTQPSDISYNIDISNNKINNGLINNGINPSFQYIYLNSTITHIVNPTLTLIKRSLITSPYNLYPTLNDILDIQCDLNSTIHDNFRIRIYTRPVFTSIDGSFDGSFNINDRFYGNYYDSVKLGINSDYHTYHLNKLFPDWPNELQKSYGQIVYYNNGTQTLNTLGEQQILSICLMTNKINAKIGIKNIIVSYK